MILFKSLPGLLRGAITMAIAVVGASSVAGAQQSTELIQNRWTPTQYITLEASQPVAGPATMSTPAAQWSVEQTAAPNVIRLRNVGTNGYLIGEGAVLRIGPLTTPDMPGASWTLERVPGIPDVRLRNSDTGGYLHTKDGPLVLGDASPAWQQSFWKFIPVAAASEPVAVIPPAPKSGCAAHNGRWLWINGKHVCAHGCPAGTHLNGNACVANCAPGFHKAGNVCVKNCKPGYHPVGGLCVKTCPPAFHPVGNVCVKNKPLCGPGQHMSKGHCCPNGKNWNNILKKCA